MASTQDDLTAIDPRNQQIDQGQARIAPRGKYSAAGRVRTFWTPGYILIALTVAAAIIAAILKTPCRVGGWGVPNVYFGGCYADWTGLWASRGFADDAWASLRTDSSFEYPVLIAVIAAVLAWIAHGITTVVETFGIEAGSNLIFYDLNFLAVVALWVITVLLVAKLAGIRYWDATIVAVAPGIVFAGFINWDMWAVALMVGAMWAFAKHQYFLSGALIGLGAAVKLFPLFLLGAILVLAIRSGRYYPILISAAGAAVAWGAVNLPMILLNPDAWGLFYEFSADRAPGWSSIWHAYTTATGATITGDQLSGYAFWSFLALCAGIAVLGLTSRHRPRLAQLMFLIVAAFILVNKVYSPQFVLWLIPLIALALPNWRDFLIFSAVELLHFWAVWGYLAGLTSEFDVQHQLDENIYLAAVAAHVVVLIYLMLRVIMDMFEPTNDVVRTALSDARAHAHTDVGAGADSGTGAGTEADVPAAEHDLLPVDDPGGAEFDGAPDKFVLRRTPAA